MKHRVVVGDLDGALRSIDADHGRFDSRLGRKAGAPDAQCAAFEFEGRHSSVDGLEMAEAPLEIFDRDRHAEHLPADVAEMHPRIHYKAAHKFWVLPPGSLEVLVAG